MSIIEKLKLIDFFGIIMYMKRCLVLVILLLCAFPVKTQELQGRILIDIGHSSQDIERILDDLAEELEINYYDTEFTQSIQYLDPYDVLVIAVPTVPFTVEELNLLHHFVDNGGGLLLLGESGALSTKNVEDFNVLASHYGIEFQRDVVVDPENNLELDKAYPEIPIIDHFESHPVTRNVRKIFLVSGCSMRLTQKARALAWGGEETYGDRLSEIYGFGGGTYDPSLEKRGEDLIVMAYCESGKGRVVALGDTSLFRGRASAGTLWEQDPLEYLDHKRLALNIFNWLSLKTKAGEASGMVAEAQVLIEQGEYQKAKDILEDVRAITQQTKDYTLSRQITNLQFMANKGIEADRLFEEGKKSLEELECDTASGFLEEARLIYEGIGNTERAEECIILLSECGDTTAMMQRADLLFEEGEEFSREGKYEEAIRSFEEAQVLYEQLEIAVKVEECRTKIDELEEYGQGEEQRDETLQRNRLILAVVLIVVTAVIVIVYVWRKSHPPYEEMHPPRRY
jgi:tetratricopeptide (TPR) repeat protein